MQTNTEENLPEIEALAGKAVEGDGDAFGKLYDIYIDRVYRHIYYKIGNKEDAEDLTQKTFLRAWDAIGKYRKTATPFIAWLLKISNNLVIDFYRSRKPHEDIDFDTVMAKPSTNPETIIEEQFTRDEIRKAIRKLKGDRQQVILMRYIEDFSYPEIAAALGKTEGAIRVILHRGLANLRSIIEKGR